MSEPTDVTIDNAVWDDGLNGHQVLVSHAERQRRRAQRLHAWYAARQEYAGRHRAQP